MTTRTRWLAWIRWLAVLALSTSVLLFTRAEGYQSPAALTMLLVVLGGSVAGGRALGFTLAVLCTTLIDYFFQPPYQMLSVSRPIDWVVLVAFLATSFVTTDLLARARQEAAAAQSRTNEVETLARLGAETLRYARAEEALTVIASLVRQAIGAESCAILPYAADGGMRGAVDDAGGSPSFEAGSAERRACERAVEADCPVFVDRAGVVIDHASRDITQYHERLARVPFLALPLRADTRVIGVLVIQGHDDFTLDVSERRLLDALCYYAALGLERMRLIAEAEVSEAMRQAARARDEIFASVSHDLRTPLTTIKVLAEAGILRGETSSLAIAEQADRLARMVGDLLEVSRLRAGGITLTPELNTAEDLFGAALRQAEGMLNGRQIDVKIDFDSPALVGRFNFVHTLRIVGNLLDNALRYTPDGGSVELRAERENGWLVLSVDDRGAGVAPTEQDRIFDAFYRPGDATPDAGHMGLGLSIARSLATVQGGTVSYEPREGGGSRFLLRLPAADVDDMSVGDVSEA